MASTRRVFVTGGTGYLGRPLIARLIERGHTVRALVRPESAGKLPPGADVVVGDALDATTFAGAVPPADTLVHLVGTAHPSPWKGQAFQDVDLRSIHASVAAAATGGVRHLVYVSVAQPAPVMHDYLAARSAGEAAIRASAVPATVLRPWYVLGPGHRWPHLLVPAYVLLERLPATAERARRLGLVTHRQMVAALVRAVEHPARGFSIVGVPEIRVAGAA
jgi:uncharacterized protein YbjT (DUF2867 family)